jgi:hypothetical protein
MPVPCEASASGQAGVVVHSRCRQSVYRGWRQSVRLSRQPFLDAGRPRRRMQQLSPAAAAEAAPKWGPGAEIENFPLMPLEEAKPVTARPGYRSFVLVS